MSLWSPRGGFRFSSRRFRNNSVELLESRCVLTPAVSAFSSLPGANHTIYLDFDGHITENTSWNNYFNNPLIVSPPYNIGSDPNVFDATELARIEESWKRVAEDFFPFQVNVTTVDPGIEALRKTGASDTQWGIRVVITADTEGSGAGGIAYIDSFNWSSDTPAWVYTTGDQSIAEAASHEAGHSLGLAHDGTASSSYYSGHGSGETDWAPIMGVGYYANITQWDRGEYYGSNNAGSGANYSKGPDDLTIITSYNGFGYRADDYGGSTFTASALSVNGSSVGGTGIIERSTDADFFTFTTGAGNITLNLAPFTPGPNLDIKADLYDSAGVLIASSNPSASLSSNFSLTLPAGQYYLSVDGTGVGNPASNPPSGYSEYASIGRYTITGNIVDAGQLPQLTINDVTVSESAGTATFTVTVAGTVADTVTVDFVTAADTAAIGSDFVATNGTLAFTPGGPTTQTIVVSIVDDATAESTEIFFVNLSNASKATISDSRGQGTIQDNDVAVTISIAVSSASKNEGTGTTATPFTFTVSRTGSTSATASVQYAVTGTGGSKSAARADDFSNNAFPHGTISFAAGESSKTLTILVKADSTKEFNEKFRVTLANPSGATLGTSTADGNIVNDDGGRTSGASTGLVWADGSLFRASEIRPVVFGNDTWEMFEGPHAHNHGEPRLVEDQHDFAIADAFAALPAAMTEFRQSFMERMQTRSRSIEQPAPSLRERSAFDRIEKPSKDQPETSVVARVEASCKSPSHAAAASTRVVDEIFAAMFAWLEA